jgi:hypothetical protein
VDGQQETVTPPPVKLFGSFSNSLDHYQNAARDQVDTCSAGEFKRSIEATGWSKNYSIHHIATSVAPYSTGIKIVQHGYGKAHGRGFHHIPKECDDITLKTAHEYAASPSFHPTLRLSVFFSASSRLHIHHRCLSVKLSNNIVLKSRPPHVDQVFLPKSKNEKHEVAELAAWGNRQLKLSPAVFSIGVERNSDGEGLLLFATFLRQK